MPATLVVDNAAARAALCVLREVDVDTVSRLTEAGSPQGRAADGARAHSRRRGATWVMVVCAVLGLGVAIRLVSISGKRSLQGDEAVSYLAATGHQLSYQLQALPDLQGRWVLASRWKSYMQADGFWGFTRIRQGLNRTDTHPPLYFWLLHVWVWILGVHLWSGPLLNTLIAVGSGLILFVLSRRVLQNPLQAAMVTVLWVVSHPVVNVTLWARDYETLAFCGLLLALVLHRLVDGSRELSWHDSVWLAIAVAAVLLSHYEATLFVFVVVAAAALIVVLQRQTRRLWHLLGGVALGLVLFVALDPGFFASFERQQIQISPLSVHGVVTRVGNVTAALVSFFWWIAMRPPAATPRAHSLGRLVVLVGVGVLGVVVLALAVLPRLRRRLAVWARRRTAGDWLLMAAGLGAAAATIVGYVLMRVPVFAMGDRYLALMWPFLALGTVCILRLLPRSSLLMVVLLVPLVVAPMSIRGFIAGSRYSGALIPPAGTPAIVFDTAQRTILLHALWSVPGDTPVFAGSQTVLLSQPSAWLGRLQRGDLLFTTRRVGGTYARSQSIIDLLRSRYEIVPYRRPLLVPGHGFQVVRAAGALPLGP